MTAVEMLAQLNAKGENTGSDFDDGVDGWFGWTVTNNVLAIHHETADRQVTTRRWRLIPIEGVAKW